MRDQLLGLTVRERDWVVVGETADSMLAAGYRQVGRDFPVFIHPDSGEEYALARTERKRGQGHTGFVCHASPDVSLEQDLLRRDLTINAIAQAPDGELIDPYGGRADLQRRVLRHISPAFGEDPLRVLRVARFAARFAHLGFVVADETLALMRQMSQSGELGTLPAERLWQEFAKALASDAPWVFIDVLRACDALAAILPELDILFSVPQPLKYHPEGDAGTHSLMVLRQATALSSSTAVRFAALVHDLGKGVTPAADWPRHIGHEQLGVPVIRAVCERLKVPNDHQALAVLACRFHLVYGRALELKPATVMKYLEQTDALRRPERFADLLLVCTADARGRLGFEGAPFPQAERFRAALRAVQRVRTDALAASGLTGKALGDALRAARVDAIAALDPSLWQQSPASPSVPGPASPAAGDSRQ